MRLRYRFFLPFTVFAHLALITHKDFRDCRVSDQRDHAPCARIADSAVPFSVEKCVRIAHSPIPSGVYECQWLTAMV
jgi:hypothetical protein